MTNLRYQPTLVQRLTTFGFLPSTNYHRPTTALPPRYNPRITFMSRLVVALVLLLCLPAAAQWTQPASQLARDIAAITAPGTITLNARNVSSLTADNIPVIKRDLTNALRDAGVRVVTSNAAADITLTISENAQGYVWVAEVKQGNDTKVAIAVAPRSQANAIQTSALVAIHKKMLWSQDSQILDVAQFQVGADSHLIVLDAANISLYKMAGGRWTPEQQFAIAHTRPWSRDIRGRIVLARDHLFDAYLPGVICASASKPPLSLNCREADEPWPIALGQSAAFSPARNFFAGGVTPAIGKLTSVPPFYSAAAIPRTQYMLWMFTRLDGSVHLMDGVNDVVARPRDWGSDIATARSPCGAQTQVFVTGTADYGSSDTIRAFEIADREPVEVAPPLEVNGPVTALWTAADGRSATTVIRNLQTGKYDALELTITCGQ